MSKKKLALLVVVLLGVGAISAALIFRLKPSQQDGQVSGATIQAEILQPVKSFGFEHDDLIKQAIDENKPTINYPTAKIGITSHHLPTAAAFISEFYNSLTPDPTSTFVIIGPDHFEHCNRGVSTTKRPYNTLYGILGPDNTIIDDLLKDDNVGKVDACFDGEHSISVHTTFIKLLYPRSKIVPLVFSSGATDVEIERVAQVLNKYKDDITVIVSVDFSHYQSAEIANQLDTDSGNMIKRLDGSGLTLAHMDSPPSINAAIALAKLWNLKPQMLRHANSYEFTGMSENTTGYWNILFTP